MLDQLEALRALHDTGTTARAAARLRITQSAVCKRIAALEARTGRELTERVGRNVRLVPEAVRLLDEVAPLLVAMNERLDAAANVPVVTIRVAAAESMLCSWLAPVLRAAAGDAVHLELHAHRGANVLARLRAGEVDVAISAEGDGDATLRVDRIGEEPMVVFAPELGADDPLGVCTIEAASLTGAWLDRRLARLGAISIGGLRRQLTVRTRIESFACALGLAAAGFGPALVPAGMVPASLAPGAHLVAGLARPVVVTTRPSARARPAVATFIEAIRRHGAPALDALRDAGTRPAG